MASVAAVLASAGPAHAAFPGANGKIAFQHHTPNYLDIWVVNPDGSGVTNLTNTPDQNEVEPAWSPDGRYIAYIVSREQSADLWVMNADGSEKAFLATNRYLFGADWSPDGERIVFTGGGLETIRPDGTDHRYLTHPDGSFVLGLWPTFSPDGTQIAFQSNWDVYVVNADGTNEHVVAGAPQFEEFPDWSPDGERIGFVYDQQNVMTIRPDGTDRHEIPDSGSSVGFAWSPDGASVVVGPGTQGIAAVDVATGDRTPIFDAEGYEYAVDWQTVLSPPPPGYPRPKAASPHRVSLVPAYTPCTSSNRTHGPPLAFASCAPPEQVSPYLTVGTPDANGSPAKSVGFVRFVVRRGNPSTRADEADVDLEMQLSDVRCRVAGPACAGGALSDYTGHVAVSAPVRITDRMNGTLADPAGTVQDFNPVGLNIPCAATIDPTIGATCSAQTTFESLVPGIVREQRRAVWELGPVEVRDGGAYGDPESDYGVFAVQGVFVP